MSLSTAKWVVFLCSLLPSQSAFVLEGSRYSYAQFRNARDHRTTERIRELCTLLIWALSVSNIKSKKGGGRWCWYGRGGLEPIMTLIIAKVFAAQFANSVKFARVNSCLTLWALHFAANLVFSKLMTQKVCQSGFIWNSPVSTQHCRERKIQGPPLSPPYFIPNRFPSPYL